MTDPLNAEVITTTTAETNLLEAKGITTGDAEAVVVALLVVAVVCEVEAEAALMTDVGAAVDSIVTAEVAAVEDTIVTTTTEIETGIVVVVVLTEEVVEAVTTTVEVVEVAASIVSNEEEAAVEVEVDTTTIVIVVPAAVAVDLSPFEGVAMIAGHQRAIAEASLLRKPQQLPVPVAVVVE